MAFCSWTPGWRVCSAVVVLTFLQNRAAEPAPSFSVPHPVINNVEAASEFIRSSDIEFSQTTLSSGWFFGRWDWKLSLSYRTFGEEYDPNPTFDPLGFRTDLSEETYAGQLEVRKELNMALTLGLSGGAYGGFDGYRSVWLANYYRQQFSLVPAYEEPDPKGDNLLAMALWEYLPARGFLDAKFGYYHDRIAPGYTPEVSDGTFRLIQGPAAIDTWAFRIASENLLSQRLRSLLEFSITDTSGRQRRYSGQASLNVALADRWVWRMQSGYTDEHPEFEAWFAAGTLEWEISHAWLLSLSGRYYSDTGEIENSLLLSNAGPGLQAWQVGVGIRHLWSRGALKLFLGPYFTNYDPTQIGTAPFANLYKDRDWWLAQAAFSLQF